MPWSLNWWLPRAEVEGCVPQTFPPKSRECPWSLDSPRVSPFDIFFFGLKTGCPAARLLALDDSKFQCSSWQKGGGWWQSRSYTLDITTCCSLEASQSKSIQIAMLLLSSAPSPGICEGRDCFCQGGFAQAIQAEHWT